MVKRFIAVLSALALSILAFFFFRPSRPNIVFLLIDTVRADHLSLFGYERDTSPNIDAFAAENLNFLFAVAPAPWTPASMASIFTGIYSSAHRMSPPNNRELAVKISYKLSEQFETMAETLKKGGYQTAAIITNPWMKPEFAVARGFDSYTYLDRAPAEKVNVAAFKLIRLLKKKREPFFLYLHYMDAHNPYQPPKEYAARYQGPLRSRQYPPQQVEYMRLYDGAIRYLDANLGDLFSFLKQEGLYQDTRIILAADHGEQFMEHGNQYHGYTLYNEEIRVPLVIKAPKLKGAVDHPVSLIDIYPTVLEMAGVKPHPHQGYSLISELHKRAQLGVLSEVHRDFSSKAYIAPHGEKIIFDYDLALGLVVKPSQSPQSIITTRPGGTHIASEEPFVDETAKRLLRKEFIKLYQETLGFSKSANQSEMVIQEETLKQLHSLGYVK